MSDRHLDEDAELYALGALEPAERRAAELHLVACDSCQARVVESESVAAVMATTLPAYDPSPALSRRLVGRPLGPKMSRRAVIPPAWMAMAAAVVIAFGFGWQDLTLQSQRAQSDAALVAVVHGHFNHATFAKSDAAAPAAKVLYARDGSWLYLVVDRPVNGLRLVARNSGAPERVLGVARSDGSVATLFVERPGRFGVLALEDQNGVRGTTTLTY